MIASTQIKNTEVFTFIAVLVFKGTLMQIWKSPCLQKTFSRRVEDVSIKTTVLLLSYVFRRRLQDSLIKKNIFILVTRLQDIFKTSSRRLAKTSSKRIQDVLQRCLQDVLKTYHQVKLFIWTRFQDVFETWLTRFWDVLQRRLSTERFARLYFWEIHGQGTKFPRVNSLDIPKLLKQFFKNTLWGDCFYKQRYYCWNGVLEKMPLSQ